MTELVHDDEDLLAEFVRKRSPRIVSVDGCHQAGKTTTAEGLARILGGHDVDVDDHVREHCGEFVAVLNRKSLRASIEAALSLGGPVIVHSVCALAVFERIGVKPDLTVYVKRYSRPDVPADLDIFEFEGADDLPLAGFKDLDQEIEFYHRKFRPDHRADVIFARLASD